MTVEAATEYDVLMKVADELEKGLEGREGIVEVTIVGKDVPKLNVDLLTENISKLHVRKVKVIADKIHETIEVAKGMATANSYEQKWRAYVIGGQAPGMEGLDPAILTEIGESAILEARKV
jgi:multidrug efflux pump subunit AcrB